MDEIRKYLVIYFRDPIVSCYAPTDKCMAYDLGITKQDRGSLEMYRNKFIRYLQFSIAQESSDYLAIALPEVISCAKGAQHFVCRNRTNTYWNVQPGKVDGNIECLWDKANNSESKYVDCWVKSKYSNASIPVRLDVALKRKGSMPMQKCPMPKQTWNACGAIMQTCQEGHHGHRSHMP